MPAFQALDRAIVTPSFVAPGSLGAPVLMAAAAATYLSGASRWWTSHHEALAERAAYPR
ncbi:MAG: hypothetical protein M3171_06660 [Actinomycetota bacterium]|nr:hypothetical protein [Actinomycetota bacterium]